MYAELALENAGTKDSDQKKALVPTEKRDAARYLVEQHRLPISRSCECVGIHRSAYYRVPTHWTVRDAEIIAALVEGRPSRGFWTCRKRLKRQGCGWNHKRIYRVYKQMNLHLRRPVKKRLPKRLRVPLYVPHLPATVWSADFMSAALSNGRRFRTFNVVDDFNREALHIEVDTSITSPRLVHIFERLWIRHGLPQVLRTHNGPEFLGEFASLRDVREATYWWRLEYNEECPHDSLGDHTPAEARQHAARTSTFQLSSWR